METARRGIPYDAVIWMVQQYRPEHASFHKNKPSRRNVTGCGGWVFVCEKIKEGDASVSVL